ncbi:hypothetical protein E2C01_008776 [Portunus trituberculatus]|uniref:Uncharacterized protein n=1 Tax=Portunus trituberculatus TaxID=210409 RepID=A0A5B7D2Q8_PORTR|nr:hypothetical protein [Portunus trituberculatus]
MLVNESGNGAGDGLTRERGCDLGSEGSAASPRWLTAASPVGDPHRTRKQSPQPRPPLPCTTALDSSACTEHQQFRARSVIREEKYSKTRHKTLKDVTEAKKNISQESARAGRRERILQDQRRSAAGT